MNIQAMTTEEILATSHAIRIVSGEGTIGNAETYTGTRTERALKMRLTRERCNGDRWARAEVFIRTCPEEGDVYQDFM